MKSGFEFQGSIGYEMRDLSITASDDVAFCNKLNLVSATKADGGKLDMWWRDTLLSQDWWQVDGLSRT